jgi:predicted Ser/Thr protein kinase
MIYIKDYKKIHSKDWHAQSHRQAFDLELECYFRISRKENFPTLLDYDKKNMILVLEHSGIDLRSYTKEKKRFLKNSIDDFKEIKFNIANLDNQIDNIIETLKYNSIAHLDCFKPGKNICYKDGKITLIDFNVAVIDQRPNTDKMDELYQEFIKNGDYVWLSNRLKKTLNKIFNLL